jgi:hypothetical protein
MYSFRILKSRILIIAQDTVAWQGSAGDRRPYADQ